MVPIISFVGPHNVGKTTILEKVISCISSRSIRVGVIKHASHNIDLDASGKDSSRLFKAGATTTVVASRQMAIEYRRLSREIPLAQICNQIQGDVDLIIVEGYKQEPLPKIEVLRQEIGTTLLNVDNRVAIVSDFKIPDPGVPVFHTDDIGGITNFIMEKVVFTPLSSK